MQIDILAQTLVNGIFLGGIYSLVAVGLTLIYGVMIIVNFAHGEFLMLGMYLSYWAFTLAGVDPYVSLPLIAVALFLFGVLVQKGLIQPVLKAPTLNQILLTMGLSTFLIGMAQVLWKAEPRTIRVPYARESIHFLGVMLPIPKLIALILSIVISISLYYWLTRSKTGKAIRACAQNRRAAQLMGIDVNWIYLLVLGIGASLTGIAGVLLIPSYPVFPTIGLVFGVTAFVIVVLGSMGNYLGAFFASMIIGVAEAFGGLFIGSDVKQVVSMGIFILVLLFRPQGLFGNK